MIMAKIGLIAGGGELPVEFAKEAAKKGERIVVFAIKEVASPELDKEADKVYWLKMDQYMKLLFLLARERVRELAFLGKVYKNVIYDDVYREELKNLRDKKDTSVFEEINARLTKLGITVIEGTRYLEHLLPEKGILGSTAPDERITGDIALGYETAKKMADMDIGQTVIVKDRSVVAVEAMEGTDAAIKRAASIAGEGCVMVKVSRTQQDMRWDIPTVGPETMAKLAENKFSALAIESGKMFLVGKEEFLKRADENSIVVEAV